MKINNRLNKIDEYGLGDVVYDKNNILDLSIGDPDLEIHPNIINALIEGVKIKNFNRYPKGSGTLDLKKAIINYYWDLYNVKLTLEEVIILIGSKEGINKVFACCCDYGDYAIIPQFGYPVYSSSCSLWGIQEYRVPITESNNYLPILENIPETITKMSKLFFINYPNNPTGAIASSAFYTDIVNFCRKHDMVLCNDGAYNEILEEKEEPISLLQFDQSKKCIEFGTFSKIYNMTGFRIGYAVGNKDVINKMMKVKSYCDSGQFIPIQNAAVEALKLNYDYKKSINSTYDIRRNLVKKILKSKNISYYDAKATFYLWCKIPQNYTTTEFCKELIDNYGIITIPGYNFGYYGHGFFRISLTQSAELIEEYLDKLRVYNIY